VIANQKLTQFNQHSSVGLFEFRWRVGDTIDLRDRFRLVATAAIKGFSAASSFGAVMVRPIRLPLPCASVNRYE
jgi:hypothetical protein